MASFLQGEIDFREQRRRRIRAVFGRQEMFDDEADGLFGRYLLHYQASWKTFPDVVAFLEKHCSEGLAVLSDGSQEQQEAKLASAGISHFFQFVVTAESTGLSKPDPRMFHYLCDLVGIAASEACYIGDNLEKDAIGASRAGLRGVWLNRKGRAVPDGVESISTLGEYQSSKGA